MTRQSGGDAPATRRALLKAMAVPAIAAGAGVLPAHALARAQSALLLPKSTCRLSRTLTRSLFDGNAIRVTRMWDIRFAASEASASGVVIEGEQVSAEVEAPASLAQIAQIEEARSTASMWPIRLTPNGMIIAAGRGVAEADLERALEVAEGVVASRYGERDARAMTQGFAAELQRAGASLLDRLPDDLFFPRIGPINLSRAVELPDGRFGEFAVSYEALAVPGKGWLDVAQRRVTTRFAGTQQTASEYWSMTML